MQGPRRLRPTGTARIGRRPMRNSCLALIAVLLAAGSLRAQQNPTAQPDTPVTNAARNQLNAILDQWEQKMTPIERIRATVVREKEDKVFRTREIFEGEARY